VSGQRSGRRGRTDVVRVSGEVMRQRYRRNISTFIEVTAR
jgi:hypothetical protein